MLVAGILAVAFAVAVVACDVAAARSARAYEARLRAILADLDARIARTERLIRKGVST